MNNPNNFGKFSLKEVAEFSEEARWISFSTKLLTLKNTAVLKLSSSVSALRRRQQHPLCSGSELAKEIILLLSQHTLYITNP